MEVAPRRQFDHQRMEVYKLGIQFVVLAGEILKGLPKGRSYIADQLRRAATSIVLNIAEGAGEFFPLDKARFYRFACRSATECAAIIDVCKAVGAGAPALLDQANDLLLNIVPMLVGLCKNMEKQGKGSAKGQG